MKKFLLGAAAALAVTVTQASAADLRRPVVKAPPVVAPAFSWAGFYIGGHAGGGWSEHNWDGLDDDGAVTILDISYPASFSFDKSGFLGGAHGGVQGQWGNIVLGVEVAGTFGNLEASTTGIAAVAGTDDVLTSRVRNLVTVVGRLGVAWDRVLLYGKGGFAAADVRTSISDPVGPITGTWSVNEWHSGWTVGGGLEYALTNNWIIGVEGNYYRLRGDTHSALDSGGAGPIFVNADVEITSVLGRLSYKFGR